VGINPLGSVVAQLYISRKNDVSGLGSVEAEYKSIKIKAAVKLFENSDTTESAVRKFEEKTVHSGCHSIIKDAEKYASEPHFTLNLQHANPRATTEDDYELISEVPPWFSKTRPKPLYENGSAQASWDEPILMQTALS